MTDPRQEDRLRPAQSRGFALPTQVLDRIAQRLSPCDDELPFAQAVRARDEMQQAAAAFRKREQKRGEA